MRDSVTFIHAADLHLDAPFQGLSAADERIGRELAEATYQAWGRIVDLAIERAVDFVVVAGDLYNSADNSLRAQAFLRDEARRLDAAGIGLFIIHGNHDPLSGWTAGLAMPGNTHVFGGAQTERAVALCDGDFVCAVYGRSFRERAEREDFTPGYRREESDTVAIGLLHSNVGNKEGYDPYAPCTLEALSATGMDYWALGHIHKHEVLSMAPYAVYAGSPQGLNPKETGSHGCCVVTVAASGVTSFEQLELASVSWALEEIDVSDASDLDRLEALLNDRLAQASMQASKPVVARVRLVGRSEVHGDLTHPAVLRDLTDRVRAEQTSRSPWVWLDRLDDASGAVIDLDALQDAPDFAGEVARISSELVGDEAMLESLVAELSGPVADKLSGYAPGLTAEELVQRARDRALDLLLEESGAE